MFVPPAVVVEGRDASDQIWIDSNIEAGVAGCGWKRPAPKPKAKAPPPKHKGKKIAPVKKPPALEDPEV